MHLILFFTYNMSLKRWDKGGLLQREIELYKKLLQKDIRVSFVTYGDKSDLEYEKKLNGIKIIPFYAYTGKPLTKLGLFIKSFFMPWILKDSLKDASIYKTNQIWGGWTALIAKKLYKKPLIARSGFELNLNVARDNENIFLRILYKFLSGIIYREADLCATTTEEIRDYINSKFNVPLNKIVILPNFIDTELFHPVKRDGQPDKVLYIGRLSKEKNIFNLIEAVSECNAKLTLLGDGPLKESLMEFAKSQNASCNFIGKMPNDKVPEIISQHSILVLCSEYEGNPKALLEAMACGTAVIGTNVCGIKNIIKDGENGLLCEKTPKSIRNALQKLLNDKDFQKELGTKATEYINKNCSLKVIIERELDLYKKLV